MQSDFYEKMMNRIEGNKSAPTNVTTTITQGQ
jgi:hypothetical protein